MANGNNLTISHDDVDGNEGKINSAHPAYSPSKTSREGSINGEDLVYASVEAMSQGKCGVGAEIYEVCFIQSYHKRIMFKTSLNIFNNIFEYIL